MLGRAAWAALIGVIAFLAVQEHPGDSVIRATEHCEMVASVNVHIFRPASHPKDEFPSLQRLDVTIDEGAGMIEWYYLVSSLIGKHDPGRSNIIHSRRGVKGCEWAGKGCSLFL
jgi:hypothetical protein